MIDFSSLHWSSIGSKVYKVTNWKDFFSIRFKGTSKRLIKVDWTHDKYLDHTLLVGYLHGTVDIFGKETTIFERKIYLGSNLILIPTEIETVQSFYLNHYKSYGGKFTLQCFEVVEDIVIDFTSEQLNNLAIELGLINNSLDLINNNLVNLPGATVLQLGSTVANQVELSLAQQEQSLITQITTLLGSAI